MKKRFEYKTVVVEPTSSFWTLKYDPIETDKILNKHGSEGWELVCVEGREYVGKFIFHYTFKREL